MISYRLALCGWAVVLLCLGFASTAGAAAITQPLFDSGKTAWSIQISTTATLPEQHAADELRDALKKISGATFNVIASDAVPTPDSNVIIIGMPTTSPAFKAVAAQLKFKSDATETLAVVTHKGNLYIAGNNPRSVLYATYYFLNEKLDFHWFWPDQDGEFYTPRQRLELSAMDYHYTPSFEYREMSPCWHPYHRPTLIWMGRNYQNSGVQVADIAQKSGLLNVAGGHTVSLTEKMFNTHPEWFSLVNGKRSHAGLAGCWSNPQYFNWLVEQLVERTKNLDIANIFPADVTTRCECADCNTEPDVTLRWFNLYNKLITEVKKHNPHVKFATIAYQEYRKPPSQNINGLEYVEYCQYNRCYVHKLNDPNCQTNVKSMAELRAWVDKAPMGIYGYEMSIYGMPSAYLPFWNMFADEMKVFRDMKLPRIKTEMAVYYVKDLKREEQIPTKHRLANYMYSQLMWNPDANVDQLLEQWCRHVYGPASSEMLAYHKAMAAAWDGMKTHPVYFFNRPENTAVHLITPELINQIQTLFAKASSILTTHPSAYQHERHLLEVQTELAIFNQWKNMYLTSRENAVAINVLKAGEGDPFADAPALPLKDKKHQTHPGQVQFRWTDDALLIRVTCPTADQALIKGQKVHEGSAFWDNAEYIEVFVSGNDQQGYRHFGLNAAGGTYDALGWNADWNPTWQSKVEVRDDQWIADFSIPFEALGGKPDKSSLWQIVVDRTTAPPEKVQTGFPSPAYHDLGGGAAMRFSESSEARSILFISGEESHLDWYKPGLLNYGWNSSIIRDVDAMNADLTSVDMVIIYTYNGNKIPEAFYQEKLLPALNRGKVVLFNAAGTKLPLETWLGDESLRVTTGYQLLDTSIRKITIAPTPFANHPYDMTKMLGYNGQNIFVPSEPDQWTPLVTQTITDGSQKPIIMARRIGKGLLAVSGPVRIVPPDYVAGMLANLLSYHRTLKD